MHHVGRVVVGERVILGLLSALVFGWTADASAQCGAFCIYEIGSPSMGRSAAGATGEANDSATAFWNPAGMTRVESAEITAGVYLGIGEVEFDANHSGTNPPRPLFGGFGNDGGNTSGLIYGPGTFATVPIADEIGPLRDVRFGMALVGLWGGSVEYSDDWVGRHFISDVNLLILNAQPGFAARVTDWLSIGASANVLYARLPDFQLISPLGNKLKADGADDFQPSYTVGFLLEPTERTRIGGRYFGEADMKLTGGDAKGFEYAFTLPQGFNITVAHEFGDDLTLYVDGGWSDWSAFSQNTIAVGPADVSFDRRWNDTWRAAIGADWWFRKSWMLQAGFSYDSSPVKASRRTPDLPVGEGYRWSVGLHHRHSERVKFGLTYTFLWFGNMDVDEVSIPPNGIAQTGRVILDGQYDPAYIHWVALHLSYRFCSPLPWAKCPTEIKGT